MGRDWVNKLSNKRIDSSHLWKTKEKEYKGTDFGKLLGVVEVCAVFSDYFYFYSFVR